MLFQLKKFVSNKKLKLFFVLVLFLPLLFINIRNSHDWGDDFAQYINQAKCIVEGKSQLETGYVFNEQNPYIGPPTYPVGFPLLLSPVYFFFGNNILAFSYLITIFLILLALIFFKMAELYFSYPLSIIITAAFIYNPWMLQFKASILSDIPFAVFFLLSIYFYLKNPFTEILNIKKSVLLGFLICCSLLIKSIGISIFFGILIDYFFCLIKSSKLSYKIKIKFFCNLFFIAISIAIFYILINYILIPSKTEHYSFFSKLFNFNNLDLTIKNSYYYYIDLIIEFFKKGKIIGSLILVLLLVGIIKKYLIKRDVSDYILLVYLFVIFAFPAVQGFRYLLPIYPFVIIYIVFGLKSIDLGIKIKENYLAYILVILLVFNYYNGFRSIIKSQKSIFAGPLTNYSTESFEYIKKNTDNSSVFAFIKPRALALYTSRKSICIGIGKSLQEIDKKFTEVGVNYILTVEDKKNEIFENYINYYNCNLIWANEKYKLYKRN